MQSLLLCYPPPPPPRVLPALNQVGRCHSYQPTLGRKEEEQGEVSFFRCCEGKASKALGGRLEIFLSITGRCFYLVSKMNSRERYEFFIVQSYVNSSIMYIYRRLTLFGIRWKDADGFEGNVALYAFHSFILQLCDYYLGSIIIKILIVIKVHFQICIRFET